MTPALQDPTSAAFQAISSDFCSNVGLMLLTPYISMNQNTNQAVNATFIYSTNLLTTSMSYLMLNK